LLNKAIFNNQVNLDSVAFLKKHTKFFYVFGLKNMSKPLAINNFASMIIYSAVLCAKKPKFEKENN